MDKIMQFIEGTSAVNSQHPPYYTVEIDGKFTTIRTNRGPVGAYMLVAGIKARSWEYHGLLTIVNGCNVTELR